MKAYIVTATINGSRTYLVRKPDNPGSPVMQAGHNAIFPATLFEMKQDALNAIDDLRHGIGKLCRVQSVEIAETEVGPS